jgi:transcriptional regulator with XRE-family HTH domain
MLGSNIRHERVVQQFSQEDLAERAGLHRTYIGMVERGERNITLLNYAKIADALNVSIHDLMKDSLYPPPPKQTSKKDRAVGLLMDRCRLLFVDARPGSGLEFFSLRALHM